MGWCSGTPIFDSVFKATVETNTPEHIALSILKALALAMDAHDWDCQGDSDYADTDLFNAVMSSIYDWWHDDDEISDDDE